MADPLLNMILNQMQPVFIALLESIQDNSYNAYQESAEEASKTSNTPMIMNEDTLSILRERPLILTRSLNENTLKNIKMIIFEGVKNNTKRHEIRKKINNVLKEADWKAERIIRTELTNARETARQENWEKSDVVIYKKWSAKINNARTGEDSKRLHGQIQKVDDSFIDPKTGDTFMHSPNRPNCRCTIFPLYKLPKKIVMKNGIMYDASMIQK